MLAIMPAAVLVVHSLPCSGWPLAAAVPSHCHCAVCSSRCVAITTPALGGLVCGLLPAALEGAIVCGCRGVSVIAAAVLLAPATRGALGQRLDGGGRAVHLLVQCGGRPLARQI